MGGLTLGLCLLVIAPEWVQQLVTHPGKALSSVSLQTSETQEEKPPQAEDVSYSEINVTPELKAFLDVIAKQEGTFTAQGYFLLFGGSTFSPSAKAHPNKCIPFFNPQTRKQDCSTAAGRYQFLNTSWAKYGSGNFGDPVEQDKAALRYLKAIGVIPLIERGDIASAIYKSCKTWASLPCHARDRRGAYSQGTRITSVSELLSFYESRKHYYSTSEL